MANSADRVRTLIVWEIPAVGSPAFVEMYLNPNNMQISKRKLVTDQRTKGGYVLQYWGEELTTVSISGSTGDGGIEALNVLDDIYRSEQIALVNFLEAQGVDIKRRQSLAQMAASVVMWYQGQGMRGFFRDFSFTESTNEMGIFNYQMTFTVVEVLGRRQNFLPWHRRPWSTLQTPSVADGRGSTTGGAYGTKFKIGELNAPITDITTGIMSDPLFTSMTGQEPSQSQLQANASNNQLPLTPGALFSSK